MAPAASRDTHGTPRSSQSRPPPLVVVCPQRFDGPGFLERGQATEDQTSAVVRDRRPRRFSSTFCRTSLDRWSRPQPLVRQNLFITVRPVGNDWTLELQSDFRAGGQGVAFRKNNFGILGLRVAKSLSVVFGSGKITGSDGQVNETSLFGQPNRWLDYSGPVLPQSPTIEGITLIDHKSNPAHPARWHVRDDGWLGPSLSREADVPLQSDKPLTVRYLLLMHAGSAPQQKINELADGFDASPALRVVKGSKAHHQWEMI